MDEFKAGDKILIDKIWLGMGFKHVPLTIATMITPEFNNNGTHFVEYEGNAFFLSPRHVFPCSKLAELIYG